MDKEQRVIKFRAWDGIYKNMIYDFLFPNETHAFSDNRMCITFEGQIANFKDWNQDYEETEMSAPYGTRFKLMQYTGLKDKNGKEIYEGDILKDEFERVDLVYWIESEARFTLRQKNRKTEYFTVVSHLSEEVIGNIYENPELWEVKNV